ncbi:MAG: DUF378 domain-containing protein [Chlamydiia bacterium]|nr:DUF378 domain-containing protein [Chlamydiia bacterium]
MKILNFVSMIFLVLSGLNWGLLTSFNFNLVDYILGQVWLDNIVYIIMGLSAIYAALNWKQLITTKQLSRR